MPRFFQFRSNIQFLGDHLRRLLNNDMNNKQFLQSIYDTVYSLGLVQSQYEFGHLCGRQDSWFSSAKSVNRQMSLGALVSLAVNLQNLPPDKLPSKARTHVRALVKSIWSFVEVRSRTYIN